MIVLVGIRAGYAIREMVLYTSTRDAMCVRYSQRLFCFVNLLFFVFLQLAQALHSLAVKPRTRRPARRRRENGDACGLHNPLLTALVWVGVGLFLALIYNRSNTVQSTPLLKDAPREKNIVTAPSRFSSAIFRLRAW